MSEKVSERSRDDEIRVAHIANWLGRRKNDSATIEIEDFRIALGSSTNLRSENQDRVVAVRFLSQMRSQSFVLLAVADGIGGMKEGGRCADLALATLIFELAASKEVLPKLRLKRALTIANETLYSVFHERGGTTLAMIYATPTSRPIGVNVGDSRIYHYVEGAALEQISTDDNVQSQMQLMSSSEGKTPVGPIGRHLTQYVGMNGPIDARSFHELSDGAYLLTSDGAHAQGAETMRLIVANAAAPLDMVKRLILISRWIGVKDNASVLFANSIGKLFENPGEVGEDTCEVWDPAGKLEIFWRAHLRSSIAPRKRHKQRSKKSTQGSNEYKQEGHRTKDTEAERKGSSGPQPNKVEVSFELVDEPERRDAH